MYVLFAVMFYDCFVSWLYIFINAATHSLSVILSEKP